MAWLDRKGLLNVPGLPKASDKEFKDTLRRLLARGSEEEPAKKGLSRKYTIKNFKDVTAEKLLYPSLMGDRRSRGLSLEDPKQFMMSFTRYRNVVVDPLADNFLEQALDLELTHVETANGYFWFRIGYFGTSFNVVRLLRKVSDKRLPELKTLFGNSWQARLDTVQREKRLYEIDLSLFESLAPSAYIDARSSPLGDGSAFVRYNPATLTLLEMNNDKALLPVMIRVWSKETKNAEHTYPARSEIYEPNTSTAGAWLYALQAAKTSATLYGIWLGHVYHFHLVTAAMLRTLSETIPDKKHAVRELLDPHSDYLIAFDHVLLGQIDPKVTNPIQLYDLIAPPSCLGTGEDMLKLEDLFAKGREFFDDDPANELAKNGLEEANFTIRERWDGFKTAQNLLRISDICKTFVEAYVNNTYRNDDAVAADTKLNAWVTAAADTAQGNIRGLPQLNNKAALTHLLTSLLYRLTAHGVSRLQRSADPWLSLVPNFPSCLQRTDLPPSGAPLSTSELLKYLPNVGTIADTLSFYHAFAYSRPYVPLIPAAGSDKELYFSGGASDPRNAALIVYRNQMQKFMEDYTYAQQVKGYDRSTDPMQWQQWPRNIET